MKTLLVLRHAKARGESASGRDFDRRLTGRGHRASAAVGRELRDRRIDAILASPAARVAETVAGLVAAAGFDLAPIGDRRLYNAPPQTLIEAIRDTDGAVGSLLIVAHNPGLQELIIHLAADDGTGLRDQVAGGFQTAALAELRLSVDRWEDVGARCGRILSLFRPSDSAPPE